MGIENLVVMVIAQFPAQGRTVGGRDISAADRPTVRASL